MVCSEEMKQFKRKASEEKLEMSESAKPATKSNFQAARDTKKIYFDESDKSKFVTVGASLGKK